MFTIEKIHYDFEKYLVYKYNARSLEEINRRVSLIKIDEWDADYMKIAATISISGMLTLRDKQLTIKDTVYSYNGLKELCYYKQLNIYADEDKGCEVVRINLKNDNLFTKSFFIDLQTLYEELTNEVKNQIIYYNSLIKKHNEELEQSQKENQENKEEN